MAHGPGRASMTTLLSPSSEVTRRIPRVPYVNKYPAKSGYRLLKRLQRVLFPRGIKDNGSLHIPPGAEERSRQARGRKQEGRGL